MKENLFQGISAEERAASSTRDDWSTHVPHISAGEEDTLTSPLFDCQWARPGKVGMVSQARPIFCHTLSSPNVLALCFFLTYPYIISCVFMARGRSHLGSASPLIFIFLKEALEIFTP